MKLLSTNSNLLSLSCFLLLALLFIMNFSSIDAQFSSGDIGLDDEDTEEEGDEMHLTAETDEDDADDDDEGDEAGLHDDELNPDDEDEEEEDEDEFDPDDNEYSGSSINVSPSQLSICQQLRFENEKIAGAFRPQCEPDGSFRRMQCHPVTRECWCVDWQGIEIPNTIEVAPEVPSCRDGDIAMTYRPVNRGHGYDESDDIVIEEGVTKSPIYVQKTTVLSKKYNPDDDDDDDDAIDESVDSYKRNGGDKNSFVESIKDPIVFAALVGGTVLGLLFIILFVMFTVYRMKKKDEGVYDLDQQNKFSSIAYTQHKHAEYFA